MRGLFVLAAAVAATPAAAQDATAGQQIGFGTSYRLTSTAMDAERTVNVWAPPGCDAESACPALYVIDGGLAQDWYHIAGLSHLGGLSGMYPAMVVVGIETGDRVNELAPTASDPEILAEYPTAGQAERFRRHLADEVIPFVEARYSLTGERAVIGESLAGLFIVDTFLTQPDLFDSYLAISPSLWWDRVAVGRTAGAALDAQDGAERRLYLTVADKGGLHQLGMDLLVAALRQRAPEGLRWTYVPRPDEAHSTIYHGAALDALRWAYADPTEGEAE
ncbi:alpha/beta hydrolase [Sphingosinithalassobacter sp. CS137]|uniref:alpha/beta hydrolase n=1 Tax=Sphingosinithalassobacter sp. CS137 TaxID=2762748 RepID=UPI00165D99E9|nr:alpha/beta hydrolase-fold protein [Sphingosinithalassobacter sp. CS137]